MGRANHTKVKLLWKTVLVSGYTIVISEDMLSTIFYINKNNKMTLEFFSTIQNRWKISPFGNHTIHNAICLSQEKNLDLEDVLQCLCAKNNDCKILITNDVKFHNCGLDVYTAEKFLEKIKNGRSNK